MKTVFFTMVMAISQLLWAQASTGQEVSGIVRIIRGSPQTEVFFKDLKDSVIIPRDSKHNKIYEACEVSMKKGIAVRLRIDPVSRQVLSMPEAAPATPAASGAPSSTESSPSPTSNSPEKSSPGSQ